MNKKMISFKIGGSLLYDSNLKLNMNIIAKVKDWYHKNASDYSKIIIFIGGGKLSRWIGNQVQDYVGDPMNIHKVASQINITNAQTIASIIGDERIFVPRSLGEGFEYFYDEKIHTVIGGSLKEGWSSDMDSAVASDVLGIGKFYKLSEIDYIYNKDPDDYPDAKPFKKITWQEYFKLFKISIGDTHKPNLSMPIDVICSQFCYKKGISMFISGGKTFNKYKDLGNIFESGTLIY